MDSKKKLALINDFIEFSQLDITSLSLQDRIVWRAKMYQFLGTLGYILNFGEDYTTPVPEDIVIEMQSFSDSWNVSLNWLVDMIEAGERAIIFDIPHCFVWSERSDADFVYGVHTAHDIAVAKVKVFDRDAMEQEKFHGGSFDSLPHQTITVSTGFLYFLRALSGYPKQSLKRCPHCQKIFFAPTNLKKSYCSPKCQKVASVYRARKKQRGSHMKTPHPLVPDP